MNQSEYRELIWILSNQYLKVWVKDYEYRFNGIILHIAGHYADFPNNLFGLLEMEFCNSLFAALFIVTAMSSVAWTAPLSYQPSDAEIVIRLSLMPTRANATKEVGYQKVILI